MKINALSILTNISLSMAILTYPRDTVFLVLGPVHPVHAVRESELCHPIVTVVLSLCCYFSHSYQLPEVDLKPFFAVVSSCCPGPMSLTVSMNVKSCSRGDVFGVVAGRGRKCPVWYMTVFQTKRKGTAVN